MRKKIFITSVGGDVACSALRCLAEEQDTYELIGCDANEYVQGKLYTDKFLKAPQYADPEAYKDFIRRTCLEEGISFFLPIGEKEIKIAATMRPFFEENGIALAAVNDEALCVATDKYRTYEKCLSIGVPVPETVRTEAIASADELPFACPAILKPVSGYGSVGLKRLPGREQVEAVLSDDGYRDGWILQREVGTEEEEYTMGVFSDGKEVSSIAFKRRLGKLSMSVWVETVYYRELEDIARRIAEALKLRGSINVQLRRENGTFYVFEINPRLSSSCGFRHLNGFKDALWWIRMLDGRAPDISFVPQVGRIGIKTYGDMLL